MSVALTWGPDAPIAGMMFLVISTAGIKPTCIKLEDVLVVVLVVGAGLAVATTTGAASTVVVGTVEIGAVVVVVGTVVVGTGAVVVVVGTVVVGVVVVGVVVTNLMGFFEKLKTVTFLPPDKNDVFLIVLLLKIPVLLAVNVLVELVLINLVEPALVLNKLLVVIGNELVTFDLKN